VYLEPKRPLTPDAFLIAWENTRCSKYIFPSPNKKTTPDSDGMVLSLLRNKSWLATKKTGS